MSDCEHTMIGADLDEREPRRNCLPGMRPPAIPVEHQPVDGEDTEWSISIPPMPVPREMRDTVAPKKNVPGLNDDAEARKGAPVDDVILGYFPNAIAEISRYAKFGNDKHNPGENLHWAFQKSTDHGNCLVRHQMRAAEIDPSSGFYHAIAVAMRALMQAETILLKNHPELEPGRSVKGFVR